MNILIKNNTSGDLVPYDCKPFSLIIGVICGSIHQIESLLDDINNISSLKFLKYVEVYILANGETSSNIEKLCNSTFVESKGPKFNVLESDNEKIIPIGQARSKLQKEIGLEMQSRGRIFAWILDDDMRIPNEANSYLSWLPAFKEKGIDILIGNFNGGSPNPPGHGIRVQLNDLVHNLNWLRGLPPNSKLPDRSDENFLFRHRYPDYYYDLSRQHNEHLVKPYWVTPNFEGETVEQAQARIIKNAELILTGEPFMRPLSFQVSCNPLKDSKPSCNRGGNTFILTPEALTLTPNAILLTSGDENRRSDMIWAIINKYYHNLSIHSVSFPVYHHRYVNVKKKFDTNKTLSEMRGSALYAAMTSFFQEQNLPEWHLLKKNSGRVVELYNEYIERRLQGYRDNFFAVNNLLDEIEIDESRFNQSIGRMTYILRDWVSNENYERIEKAILTPRADIDVEGFIESLDIQIKSFGY